jgi:hypothetical protein
LSDTATVNQWLHPPTTVIRIPGYSRVVGFRSVLPLPIVAWSSGAISAERQEVGRWANNWVESLHLPFRRRERAMLGFRQMKTLQKFASITDHAITGASSSTRERLANSQVRHASDVA